MHELSLCGSIADIARRNGAGRRVARIHLRIGQLRQVVPETLVHCWSMVRADTELADAELVIDRVPARIRCHECDHVTEIGDFPILVCEECDGVACSVESGEEFEVTAMDLVTA